MAVSKEEIEFIKKIRIRYILVPTILLLSAVLVGWKVFHIQFVEGDELRNDAEKAKTAVQHPRRGDILDRNGKVLACSVPEYEIYFDARVTHLKKHPELIKDNIDAISSGLAAIFEGENGCSKEDFQKLLTKAMDECKIVKLHNRPIDYNHLQAVKKLPLFCEGPYKGGFSSSVENNRVYPYGGMAKRTIGFLRKGEFRGQTGLESYYNDDLYGEIETATGRVISDGCDLITTIDADIQVITHEELTKTLKQYDAEWGCAVVMDVKTGEILSISNLSHNEDTLDLDFYENWNYAVSNVSDPGSTIKLPSLMVALEDNCIKLDDTIDTGDGQCQYANGQLTVTDWNHKTQGGFHKLSVIDVFANSSNVGVSKIIDQYYVKPSREWDYIDRIKSMNLAQPSGIDLVNEPSPNVKDPSQTTGTEKWTGLTLLQMSYGYEIELTPLQILTFYNAVANDGKMMRPHLMKEIRYDSKTVRSFKPQSVKGSICKKETLRKAREMMEAVVERGTAKKCINKYYKIAGKTGTAQTFEKGHYNKNKLRGSFCGYFPADNPKYSCIVVIQSKTTENYSAVGVFKNIADRIYFMDYELRGKSSADKGTTAEVLPATNGFAGDLNSIYKEFSFPVNQSNDEAWVKTTVSEEKIEATALRVKTGFVPNFEKMGMRDAVFLADSLGLRVRCEGSGRVYRQSVSEGTPYIPNSVITLTLR